MPLRSKNRRIDRDADMIVTPDRGMFFRLEGKTTVSAANGERISLVTDGDGNLFVLHSDREGNLIGTRRTMGHADARILASMHPELDDVLVAEKVSLPVKKGLFKDKRYSSFEDPVWCRLDNHGFTIRSIRTPDQVEDIAETLYPAIYGNVDVVRDSYGRVKRITAYDDRGKVSEEFRYDREKAKDLNRRCRR